VDKTIRHTKQSVGVVKRLSAAVVVNHRKEAGKTTSKPLSDIEIKQINDLVKEAMGFSKDRGDTISVANAPFTIVDKNDTGIPLWKDPEILSIIKDLVKYGAVAGIIAYLLLGVARPMLKSMLDSLPKVSPKHLGSNLNIVADDEEDLGPSPAATLEKKIEQARDVAQQDPKIVANIIKDWTSSNAS
jgi:flagellar M-ring protein FliF